MNQQIPIRRPGEPAIYRSSSKRGVLLSKGSVQGPVKRFAQRRWRTLASLSLATLLAACSDGNPDAFEFSLVNNQGGACGIEAQRNWVDANMRDYYLFYDQVPTLRLSDYDTAEQLITDLRVSPDRFSYVGDAALNEAFFEEGKDFGYGWRLRRRDDNSLAVALVEPESPLATAGVIRGDTLVSIDGVDVASIVSSEQADELFGTGTDTRFVTLELSDATGDLREVDVTRGQYNVKAVLENTVVDTGNARVGYLSFLTFIETAREELAEAFANLASDNIDELVIDLRFNGGGRIDVANELASRVIGNGGENRNFLRYQFNDKYQSVVSEDSLREPFKALDNSLDLARVYVLTTPSTCSASELVINGLSPYVDVITVGDTSCGKPYGTSGRYLASNCNKVMHAVEVEFVNDSGVGDYAAGLPATCAASDEYREALGDPTESLLFAALQHVSTGSCTATLATNASTVWRASAANAALNPVNPHRSEFPLP